MTDIIERLRSVGKDYDFHENALIYEAADEIERLRQRVEEFKRAGGPVGDPRHKGYTLNYRPHQGEEITRLREQNALLHKEIEGYAPWRELQRTNMQLMQKAAELEAELNTFKNAVDHVTADGKTSRAFSVSEGWAMVHKDRLLDLECAEEELAALKSQAREPVAWAKLFKNGQHALALCKFSDAVPLFTAPPQAEALVADFKRRAVEVCMDYYEQANEKTLHGVGERFSAIGIHNNIDSLPLIEGEQG